MHRVGVVVGGCTALRQKHVLREEGRKGGRDGRSLGRGRRRRRRRLPCERHVDMVIGSLLIVPHHLRDLVVERARENRPARVGGQAGRRRCRWRKHLGAPARNARSSAVVVVAAAVVAVVVAVIGGSSVRIRRLRTLRGESGTRQLR